MSNNAHDLSNRLLKALDDNYNVVDMRTVNEIISILEKINITKELLETTRLGKHVNELRRKTSDQTLARRAKVLVKRWRDLVIPNVASPAHTGSNRSSAERQVRRLGGTPLTSPALSRQVVSPAVASPRLPSRPAWGGYESDSQDVILVDDEPPSATAAPAPAAPPAPPALPVPLANTHKPHTPPTKRPLSPASHHDERKAKRDKKPKRRRGHSRAGDGAEASASVAPITAPVTPHAAAVTTGTAWSARNGTPHGERRKNGCRSDTLDPYAALVKRMPPAGAKKVKTTKELLEQIQSRGGRAAASPCSPRSPASPDVMLIEPDPCPIKVESPLRNGSSEPTTASPSLVPPAPSPLPPLEDEREYAECTCGELADEQCAAASRRRVRPEHVRALHDAYLPGVNGTRAPAHPHQYAVRKPADPDRPDLFYSVVPLYKYSDYADDYCVKNMSRVPLSAHLPWTEFAPSPPPPPPPPSPPPLRPYPIDSIETKQERDPSEPDEDRNFEDGGSPSLLDVELPDEAVQEKREYERPEIGPEMVGVPSLEASERLKAPLLSAEDENQFDDKKIKVKVEIEEKLEVAEEFKSEQREHRTVERTKEEREMTDGRTLYALCERARATVPYSYSQTAAAPVVTLPDDEPEVVPTLEAALARAEEQTERDEFGRPRRAHAFTEWHECARLGDLLALPYVVID